MARIVRTAVEEYEPLHGHRPHPRNVCRERYVQASIPYRNVWRTLYESVLLGKINVQPHRQFGICGLRLRGNRATDTYEYCDSHNSDKRT
jgi:hypothetical protein